VFNLKPAARYEFKVDVRDPDGGGSTRTVAASTRAVPTIPDKGNVIHVRRGGDALKEAVKTAKPGDIFLVHAGRYNGPVVVTASGTPAAPIVIRSAGDGEAVILGPRGNLEDPRWDRTEDQEAASDCVNLAGSHIRFHEMSVHGGFIGIYHGVRRQPPTSIDISVTRCKFTGCHHSMYGRASRSYFADNVIKGTWQGGNEGEGIELNGSANVICFNRITHCADAVSIYEDTSDCDVHNNDIIHEGDDALELDYSGPNTRVFDNRMSYTGPNGVSFQPYAGGPAYLLRNLVFNTDENCIKDRFGANGLVLVNNTMVSRGSTALISHVWGRNNLFLTQATGAGAPALSYHASDLPGKLLDLDYNGCNGSYRPSDRRGASETLEQFHRATGLESHGVLLTVADTLNAPLPTREQISAVVNARTGSPHPDLSLKEGSAAIDRGVAIPNVAEDFKGKAPDLGALEFGAPAPHFGVRSR
jgi:hypothetical protein